MGTANRGTVMKFGGTSVATGQRLESALRFVAETPEADVVVFSAPGKRADGERKVTEILISAAERRAKGLDAADLVEDALGRYRSIADHFGVEKDIMPIIEADLSSRHERSFGAGPRARPIMESGGEANLALLASYAAEAMGIDAAHIGAEEAGFTLTPEPSKGQVHDSTYGRLARFRGHPRRIFTPGYIGVTADGHENTLERGGSDITGAVWAAALGAERYLNCTDTDGVYSADPRRADFARRIPEVTFLEARELGFSVIHPSALVPVDEARIPTRVLSTMDPRAPGTLIMPERDYAASPIVGVSVIEGCRSFRVTKLGMNKLIGFGGAMYSLLAEHGISYSYDITEADSVQVYPHDPLRDEAAEEVARALGRRLEAKVSLSETVDIVRLAGAGLSEVEDIDYRPLLALAEQGIARTMHIYSRAGISYTVGVEEGQGYAAARALHESFVGRPLERARQARAPSRSIAVPSYASQ